MVNRAIAHLEGRTPYVLHRLDAPTSGVLLFAKSVLAARDIQLQFRTRLAEKAYLAVLLGQPACDGFTVDMPIATNPNDKTLSLVVPKVDVSDAGAAMSAMAADTGPVLLGKESLTHFEVLERAEDASACLVRPRTGRMHQIRVHAEHLGHPLAGDTQYGLDMQARYAPSCSRLLLHAHSLRIRHPAAARGGDADGKAFLRFTAPPPDAFAQDAARLGVGQAIEALQRRGASAEWEQ